MGFHGVPEVSLRIHGVPQGSRGFCRQSAVRIMTGQPLVENLTPSKQHACQKEIAYKLRVA